MWSVEARPENISKFFVAQARKLYKSKKKAKLVGKHLSRYTLIKISKIFPFTENEKKNKPLKWS